MEKKKKDPVQVSESCSPFMCNYQCISTACAIIFIVTFIHVMPLLIWLRYELLTVSVLVVKRGEGGKSQVLCSMLKQGSYSGMGKSMDQLWSAQKANKRDEPPPKFPSFPPRFFKNLRQKKKKREIPTNT